MNIFSKKWDNFKISSLFSLDTKNNISNSKNVKSGDYPLISAKNMKNGVDKFIDTEKLNEKNAITWNKQGNGGAGLSFYQPTIFANKSTVFVLRPKLEMSKYHMTFIVSLLNRYHGIFNHGYALTQDRFYELLIPLPVNEDGNPDLDIIEKYMKELEFVKLNKYKHYLKNKLKKLTFKEVPELNEKEWRDFSLTEFGTITSGINITKKEMIAGKIPYVSATSKNNGVSAYIGNNNRTLDSNCISINRNGSVGYSFYHPYTALFAYDCRILKTKYNKHVSLFITNQIKAQKDKYNYGYKMGTKRLQRQKILLPVDDEGNPDYNYMEQYMINLEIKLMNKYKKHLQNQIYTEYISEKESLMR